MSLKDLVPFSNYYKDGKFVYSNILNRNDFLLKLNDNNIFSSDVVNYSRETFHNMNNEFFKQFIQKGFSVGDSMKYMFCLVPYNENIKFEYYIQALKKMFYHGFNNNIEIIYCLVTTKDYSNDELYYELKEYISSEIFLEKVFNVDTQENILKYIKFCSMFDSFILIDDELIYWSWYLSHNWDNLKIIAPNSFIDKIPSINSNSFIDV